MCLFFELFKLECAGVELVIGSFFRNQLFVAAAFDDAAVVEDHDDIGILDGGQAVRDDEARAPLEQMLQAGLQRLLGARVDVACRLVQDQDTRVGEQHAREGDELALALLRYR